VCVCLCVCMCVRVYVCVYFEAFRQQPLNPSSDIHICVCGTHVFVLDTHIYTSSFFEWISLLCQHAQTRTLTHTHLCVCVHVCVRECVLVNCPDFTPLSSPISPPRGNGDSTWPQHDEQYLVEDSVTVVVQVNGKVSRDPFTCAMTQSYV